MSMTFFELFLKFGHLGLRARLVHLRRTLVAEATVVKESMIGTTASIAHAIPLLYRPLQVCHRPELTIGGGRRRAKQMRRCIGSQSLAQFDELLFCQLGPVATHSLVDQTPEPLSTVSPAPLHQSAPATPGNAHHLLCWVAGPVQSHRLIASPGQTIFAACVRARQFLDLLFRELKSSSRHSYII